MTPLAATPSRPWPTPADKTLEAKAAERQRQAQSEVEAVMAATKEAEQSLQQRMETQLDEMKVRLSAMLPLFFKLETRNRQAQMASEIEKLHIQAKQRADDIVAEVAAANEREAAAAEEADRQKQREIAEARSEMMRVAEEKAAQVSSRCLP